jgi:hypothetical protein
MPNKIILAIAFSITSYLAIGAQLDAHSNTKVNGAKAKAWSNSAVKSTDAASEPALQKQIVNIGSKKKGTCNLNVGTVTNDKKFGNKKQPKEVIVTAKDIINVCD